MASRFPGGTPSLCASPRDIPRPPNENAMTRPKPSANSEGGDGVLPPGPRPVRVQAAVHQVAAAGGGLHGFPPGWAGGGGEMGAGGCVVAGWAGMVSGPAVTSVTPSAGPGIWYRAGPRTPRGRPAAWAASATMPANSGAATLVPATVIQPGCRPGRAL